MQRKDDTMPPISHASELLKRGESAIVLFTDGNKLQIHSDGSGQTGNWKVDRTRSFGRVIIYKRSPQQNVVYTADRSGITDSDEEGRSVVHFVNAEPAGITDKNWYDFADANANPVRYLNSR